MSEKRDPMKYSVRAGTVRPYLHREGNRAVSMFTQHFGRAAYDRGQSVLSESLREQGQAVADALNTSKIDEDEARRRLRRISF